MMRWLALVLVATACSAPTGELRLTLSGGNEAVTGIAASATADGWSVRFEHALIAVIDVRARTSAGADAMLAAEPTVVDLAGGSVVLHAFPGVGAQRWDDFSFHLGPVPEAARAPNVDPALVERMRAEGWSAYYEGVFVAPAGTVDADGNAVTEVPFELGFPVAVDYARCVSGTDRTSGVVVPLNSVGTHEISWHLTHLFFDSFAEDAELRVEALAARWTRSAPVRVDDLDVSLGSLRGMNGRPLTDRAGNPVVYIPGMTGATTLREFVLSARPGHFDGLEGFCTTDLRILE